MNSKLTPFTKDKSAFNRLFEDYILESDFIVGYGIEDNHTFYITILNSVNKDDFVGKCIYDLTEVDIKSSKGYI